MTVPPVADPPKETTPPNPSPTNDTNTQTLELYDRILAEKEAELRELRNRVNAPPPAPPAPLPDASVYFADPAKVISEMMDKKLAESVAPLNQFVLVQRRRDALSNYRSIAANDPRVVKFWPHISAKFDALGSKYIETNDVNEQIVAETIKSLIAEFAMTQPLEYAKLIGTTAAEPPKPEAPKVVTPPSIPPSSTEPPANADPNKVPQLSENEMRLARERWPELSHQDAYKKYDSLRNPGSFVVVPKKQGGK